MATTLRSNQSAIASATSGRSYGTHQSKFFQFVFLMLMAQVVVVPHSLQAVTGASLVVVFIFGFYKLTTDHLLTITPIDYWLLINIIVNVFYIFIGINNGASEQSIYVNLVTYIVSPIFWVYVAKASFHYINERKILYGLYWLTILAGLSVVLFFYLFLSFGSSSVEFWTGKANIVIDGGQVGATMLVYGSFLFSTAAFISTPEIVKNIFLRGLILLVLTAVAFTSGRAALVIAIVIGITVGFVIRVINNYHENIKSGLRSNNKSSIIIYFVGFFVVTLFALFFDLYLEQIDLFEVLGAFMEKISGGGGDVRSWQYQGLIDGVWKSNGLGMGHGVGISIIRDYDAPWRYELTLIATLYRLGIIGTLLVLLPYIMYFLNFTAKLTGAGVTKLEGFMFSGFTAFVVASYTNPYPESFIFQFMLFLPLVYFYMGNRVRNNGKRRMKG